MNNETDKDKMKMESIIAENINRHTEFYYRILDKIETIIVYLFCLSLLAVAVKSAMHQWGDAIMWGFVVLACFLIWAAIMPSKGLAKNKNEEKKDRTNN